MRKIIWSRKAAEDLRNIYTFYSVENKKAAFIIYQQIKTETNRLKDFPFIAAIENLLQSKPETYSSLVVRNIFKVVYHIENNNINVVAVWDCRQNPETLKESIK
ncbi:MAG: type II toxin-antitoxin system RelE/ParE family toxin [Tannerellaceae bacterium]|nr:type II toxin-antitoxin system RelE/ParE family toxin [Tannerellaceae bacterium]